MALFSIKNERDLIVLNAITSQTTAATFATSGAAGEGKIFDLYGATPTGKNRFSVYVKHLDGRLRKSDVIDPDKIIYVKKQVPVSPVLPSSTVTFDSAVVGDLYEILVKIFNDGSLSNDDVVLLNGSFTATTTSLTDVYAGLAVSLNASLIRMGQTWFTVTSSGSGVVLQSTALPFVTGKKDGRAIDYNIKGTHVSPTTLVTGTTTIVNVANVLNPCSITYLQDLEWQTRGAFGDSLRGLAYPFDFALQSDVVTTTVYTLYDIAFWGGDQNDHAVQKSPRQLTIAVPAANVAAFDAELALVRQVIDLTTAATDSQQITWTDAAGTYHPAAK